MSILQVTDLKKHYGAEPGGTRALEDKLQSMPGNLSGRGRPDGHASI